MDTHETAIQSTQQIMQHFKCDVYEWSEIPTSVRESIETDLITLTKAIWPTDMPLELSTFDSIETRYLDEKGEKDMTTIPYELDGFGLTEEMKRKWKASIDEDCEMYELWTAAQGRCVLSEQYKYLDEKCKRWLVIGSCNTSGYSGYYGGVFVFHAPGTTYLRMQGISKYSTPLLQGLFLRYPKTLNSVLLPAIQELTLSLGLHEIRVSPIGKQSYILGAYHGFKWDESIPRERYPSNTLLQESWKYNDYMVLRF